MRALLAFLGLTVAAGVTTVLTSNNTPVEYDIVNVMEAPVVQIGPVDSTGYPQIMEYPSVEDAAVITNIPDTLIIESILTGKKVEGYEFSSK